ncbi:ABC transporter permease [Roseivirga sp. 4D4]|uniref:ABC transporter permease n=1 Tax=Roseivirga sp. 4D4 TaxID=1889784 RepID=UPI00147E6296|nr:ABC transporter permease [Roseivirga sp. 4D4]
MQKLKRTQDFVPKFGNYFKVALRNFGRHKLVAGINLIGLTVGLAVMIFSAQYLQHQLTADRYMPDSDSIYRIVRNYRSQTYSNLGFPNYYNTSRANQLAHINAFRDVPEVEVVGQLAISNSNIMGREFFVEANDRRLRGGPILYTNTATSLQEIFQWKFIMGTMTQANAEGVVLSDKTAKRYFGDLSDEIVGSTVYIDDKAFLVRGIVEHIPENAHFDFNMIAVVDSIPYSWGAYTYAKLKPNTKNLSQVAEKITRASYINDPEAETDPLEKGLNLQPLRDIHLGSDHLYEIEANVKPIYIYLFAAIGLIVLIITITNYVNLAVAINANRFKEVGVRKVIGARKKDVFAQFISEAVISIFVALLMALLLVYTLLPYFNQLLSVGLEWADIFKLDEFLLLSAFCFSIGVLSGLYPSALLSSKPLLKLLSNSVNRGSGKMNLRKTLLGFQFFLLVLMAGFAFYVNAQLNYVTETDLGFEKDGILTLDIRGAEKFKLLKDQLLKNPNVLEVGSGGTPGNMPFNTITYKFEDVDEVFDDANQIFMDYSSAKMFGLKSEAFKQLEAGKDKVFLLNRAAGRKYEKLTQKPMLDLVGANLIEEPEWIQDDGTAGDPEVIDGFVQDFHYFTKRESFNPLLIQVYNDIPWVYEVNVKLQTEDLFETMAFIEDAYYDVEKDKPFAAQFLDERLDSLYTEEFKVAAIVKILSILSIVLALAGLIGLTYYSAKLRQREVAIRKVLGANVLHVLRLMSKEFFWVGLLAMIAALPITLYVINQWLGNFAFHIESQLWVLVAIGIAGLVIMLLGVISQSYRTTKMNLVEPLKQE